MKKAIPVIICCLLLVVAAFGLFEYTKTLSQINRTMGYQLRAIDDAVESAAAVIDNGHGSDEACQQAFDQLEKTAEPMLSAFMLYDAYPRYKAYKTGEIWGFVASLQFTPYTDMPKDQRKDALELIRRMGADVIQSDFTSGDGKPYNFILDKKKIKDVLKGLNDACREYNEKW